MIGDKDVHAVDIVFNAWTAAVFYGVHDAVDHDLRPEGIVTGHSNHAALSVFAAGRDTVCVFSAAFRTGTVMCYDDCELRERLTPDLTADVGVVIHNGQAAEDKGRFIIRDIQNHSAASGAVDPEPVA